MKGYVEFLVFLIIIVVFYSAPSMFSHFYSSLGGRLVLLGLIAYFALESSVAGILGVILYVVLANKQIETMENMDSKEKSSSNEDTNSEDEETDDEEPKQEKVSQDSSVADFRKSVCQNGTLKLQGKELDEKMKSVKFLDGKCNVCDDDCRFEITSTAEQLTLDEMMRPKDSNTMTPDSSSKEAKDEVQPVAVKANLKEGFLSG